MNLYNWCSKCGLYYDNFAVHICPRFEIKITKKELPCGCIPGSFLCPEAERLWKAKATAYDLKDWNEYDKLTTKYKDHVW